MDHVLAAAAATTAAASKRHTQEIGLAIAAVGAVAVILSASFGIRSMSRALERGTMIVAGVLLTAGFIVQLMGLHSTGK